MIWQSAALAAAGLIGVGVAVLHGVLVQRLMVRPFEALTGADLSFSRPVQRLMPPLLHFSTFAWLLGGFALIAAARWFGRGVRFAIGALVGTTYLFGAILNAWATRGRHPGWLLMALSAGLILLSLVGSHV